MSFFFLLQILKVSHETLLCLFNLGSHKTGSLGGKNQLTILVNPGIYTVTWLILNFVESGEVNI